MWYYDGQHLGGMHLIWWIVWFAFLLWIFAIPYDIPGQRNKKEAPLDILKKRLAAGEIDSKEFEERKKLLK